MQDCPTAFDEYLTYVRNLSFDQTPDYEMMINLFRNI